MLKNIRYDLNNAERILEVIRLNLYSNWKADGFGENLYQYLRESLRRAKNFQSNQEWANLKKLAERIDDNYIKFYWLGLASENLNDLDFALQNYIKSLRLKGDPRTRDEVRNRTLSLMYKMNKFEAYMRTSVTKHMLSTIITCVV